MTDQRHALIVANYDYQDDRLRALTSPQSDATALSRVLSDPDIGGFSVKVVINEPHYIVRREIDAFFKDRSRDDLLLLYFSGHGVKDEDGHLYLATTDTQRDWLASTGVEAQFVHRVMEKSLSRRQILILDCCYSGAFGQGLLTKSDDSIATGEQFGGRGRVVLTASDSVQFAFEGRDEQTSVFTSALIAGLETGEADQNQDGYVDVDEWYAFAHDRVSAEIPNQRPSKSALEVHGALVVARNPHADPIKATLPAELIAAMDSPFAGVREGTVTELARLLDSHDPRTSRAARLALERLLDDDSRSVSAAAQRALDVITPDEETDRIDAWTSINVLRDGQLAPDTSASTPSGPTDTKEQTKSGGERAGVDEGSRPGEDLVTRTGTDDSGIPTLTGGGQEQGIGSVQDLAEQAVMASQNQQRTDKSHSRIAEPELSDAGADSSTQAAGTPKPVELPELSPQDSLQNLKSITEAPKPDSRLGHDARGIEWVRTAIADVNDNGDPTLGIPRRRSRRVMMLTLAIPVIVIISLTIAFSVGDWTDLGADATESDSERSTGTDTQSGSGESQSSAEETSDISAAASNKQKPADSDSEATDNEVEARFSETDWFNSELSRHDWDNGDGTYGKKDVERISVLHSGASKVGTNKVLAISEEAFIPSKLGIDTNAASMSQGSVIHYAWQNWELELDSVKDILQAADWSLLTTYDVPSDQGQLLVATDHNQRYLLVLFVVDSSTFAEAELDQTLYWLPEVYDYFAPGNTIVWEDRFDCSEPISSDCIDPIIAYYSSL